MDSRIDVDDPAAYERQATGRAMRRDYWVASGEGLLIASGRIHSIETDTAFPFFLPLLLESARIRDGDEFEVTVTATGRRPHGDRRFLRDVSGSFRPETDEECLRRIEFGNRSVSPIG